jgi:uncharacterized protein YcbX
MTTVDPDAGVRDANQEPLVTLRKYRLNKPVYKLEPMFGLYFSLLQSDNTNNNNDHQVEFIQLGDKIVEEI